MQFRGNRTDESQKSRSSIENPSSEQQIVLRIVLRDPAPTIHRRSKATVERDCWSGDGLTWLPARRSQNHVEVCPGGRGRTTKHVSGTADPGSLMAPSTPVSAEAIPVLAVAVRPGGWSSARVGCAQCAIAQW